MVKKQRGLGVLCGVLLITNLLLLYKCLWFQVHLALANDQTLRFERWREQGNLDVIREYPSGTKQETGSLLDLMVERHRASVIREIKAREMTPQPSKARER